MTWQALFMFVNEARASVNATWVTRGQAEEEEEEKTNMKHLKIHPLWKGDVNCHSLCVSFYSSLLSLSSNERVKQAMTESVKETIAPAVPINNGHLICTLFPTCTHILILISQPIEWAFHLYREITRTNESTERTDDSPIKQTKRDGEEEKCNEWGNFHSLFKNATFTSPHLNVTIAGERGEKRREKTKCTQPSIDNCHRHLKCTSRCVSTDEIATINIAICLLCITLHLNTFTTYTQTAAFLCKLH